MATLERDHKAVNKAAVGENVAIKIESRSADESGRLCGRHFFEQDTLYSHITRESINALKSHFKKEMTMDDWRLVVKLKKLFSID